MSVEVQSLWPSIIFEAAGRRLTSRFDRMMRRSNSRRPPESDGAGYRTGALDGLAAIAAPRRPGTCVSVLGLVADAMKAPITQAIDSSGLGSTIPRSGGEQDSAAAKMFRAVFTAEMRDFFLPTITS